MNMNDKSQLELEQKIHSLICGDMDEKQRQEALELLAHDTQARKVLTDMLDVQKASRAAFGYDHVDEAIARSMPSLNVMTGEAKSADQTVQTDTGKKKSVFHRFGGVTWVWRIAAMFVVGVFAYLAITAHRSNQNLQTQLDEIRQSITAPAMTLTADDINRYRTVWSQVSEDDDNTWVLLTNGDGEFGSIAKNSQQTNVLGKVLLVQYRILDQAGNCIYTADLLIPDRKLMEISLPDAGSIAGLPASLTIAATGDHTTIGLSVGNQDTLSAGVVGRMFKGGATKEIGSFNLDGEHLRVFARTQHLNGMQS